jgi:hypothetical protein
MTPVTNPAMSGIGQAPVGLVEGSLVFGIFLDGKNAQMPLILGSIAGIPGELPGNKSGGFRDPNGKYPTEIDKPDTPKLAYDPDNAPSNQIKKDLLEEYFPYTNKPVYPYNKAINTESGHTIEVDDTDGNERIGVFHRAGTFIEVLPDGTYLHHVIKDSYRIIAGDDTVTIKGFCNITIDEDASLRVKGNLVQEVDKDYSITVHGDMTINNDVTIKGKSIATEDHISNGISGHDHVHQDTKGLGAGKTTTPVNS